MILTKRSPEAHFVSIDHSQESIEEAQASITNAGISNAVFYQMDLLDLKFKDKGEINL